MREIQNCLGLPLVSLDTAEPVGIATHFLTDPVRNRIVGIVISEESSLLGKKGCLFTDVAMFGPDAILLEDTGAVRPLPRIPELLPLLDSQREPFFRQAWTSDGQRLGRFTEHAFDEASAQVLAFHLELCDGGSILVPYTAVVSSGRALTLFHRDALPLPYGVPIDERPAISVPPLHEILTVESPVMEVFPVMDAFPSAAPPVPAVADTSSPLEADDERDLAPAMETAEPILVMETAQPFVEETPRIGLEESPAAAPAEELEPARASEPQPVRLGEILCAPADEPECAVSDEIASPAAEESASAIEEEPVSLMQEEPAPSLMDEPASFFMDEPVPSLRESAAYFLGDAGIYPDTNPVEPEASAPLSPAPEALSESIAAEAEPVSPASEAATVAQGYSLDIAAMLSPEFTPFTSEEARAVESAGLPEMEAPSLMQEDLDEEAAASAPAKEEDQQIRTLFHGSKDDIFPLVIGKVSDRIITDAEGEPIVIAGQPISRKVAEMAWRNSKLFELFIAAQPVSSSSPV